MQLLKRAEQLEQLQLLLNEAVEGNGHVAVLVGQAGAGKSAIVNIFTDLVGKTTRVLRGACENFGTAEPLGPLRDLAREAGWALSETLSSTESRIALFSEVFRLLNVGAATSLIVIEDIHWADDATLNLIWHEESRNRPSLAVKLSIRPMTASGPSHQGIGSCCCQHCHRGQGHGGAGGGEIRCRASGAVRRVAGQIWSAG